MERSLKLVLCWLGSLLLRLIPGKLPNLEGVMATGLPVSSKYGALVGFGYAASSMLAFDLLVGRFGLWSWWTAAVYGLISLAGVSLGSKKQPTRANFVWFALWGTLAFDALTGLTIGPLFWGQSLMVALWGQIPFTLFHLLSNLSLAAVVSPWLYQFLQSGELVSIEAPQVSTQFDR